MRSVFEPAVREEFLSRVSKLTPDAQARWGKFTATKMLAHVNDAMRMAIGELVVKPKRTPLKSRLARYLFIEVLPWPKGAPTAPELLARVDTADFGAEQSAYKELLQKVAATEHNPVCPEHPAFGKMSRKEWGNLGFRHTDHHFRQFGI